MVCLFYLSSQRNQLLLLIFAIVTFISFSLISALIFIMSFLLLTLGFIISSFSSCFRCKVRLFIWFFSLFFLINLANGFSIYLLKELAFSFVDFCYGLLCFFFIYFCPNFYDFFPSTNPGVLHFSFSISFRCSVRLFDFSLVS